jgi:hypothetical protein
LDLLGSDWNSSPLYLSNMRCDLKRKETGLHRSLVQRLRLRHFGNGIYGADFNTFAVV